MKILLALALSVSCGVATASCPEQPFTRPEDVRLDSDPALLVVHASNVFDPLYASKHGIEAATRYARLNHIRVVYLQDDADAQAYFTDDCRPDYRLRSEYGELSIEIRAAEIYLAGGHLEQCLHATEQDVLSSWSRQPRRNRTLTYLMDGIYSDGELVRDEDGYSQNFALIWRALNYHSNEDDEHPGPKITLLQSLGLIGNEAEETAYLKRALPDYTTFAQLGYRVAMQVNTGPLQILREASAASAPTLLFRFVDSASDLALP